MTVEWQGKTLIGVMDVQTSSAGLGRWLSHKLMSPLSLVVLSAFPPESCHVQTALNTGRRHLWMTLRDTDPPGRCATVILGRHPPWHTDSFGKFSHSGQHPKYVLSFSCSLKSGHSYMVHQAILLSRRLDWTTHSFPSPSGYRARINCC